jgi:hypothetical protein
MKIDCNSANSSILSKGVNEAAFGCSCLGRVNAEKGMPDLNRKSLFHRTAAIPPHQFDEMLFET